MPTERIAPAPPRLTCTFAGHRPSTEQEFELGYYEHTCPECGDKVCFAMLNPNCLTWPAGASASYYRKNPDTGELEVIPDD